MDDQVLVDVLDGVWRSIEELGESLSEDDWKQPTELPGWSVQDTMVHLSSLEAMSVGRPWTDLPDPPEAPHVVNDFGRHNERAVHSRRAWTGTEALTEFRTITRERIDGLRALDRAGFDAESWTPVGPGTVRALLPFRIFDSYVHEQDMRRGVSRPGGTASPAAAVTLDEMAGVMPFIVGKKAAAPDGSTVVFSLGEPLARTVSVEVVDRRGRLVDAAAAPVSPTVTLAMSTITFERLGCGRIDPDASLAAGDVVVNGDVELGARIVRAMNYMF